jgi:hypothetical protein
VAAWERAGFRRGTGFSMWDAGRVLPPSISRNASGREGRSWLWTFPNVSSRILKSGRGLVGLTNVRTVQGSVERLAIGDSGFDGAYARWVLCFVRRPAAVLRQVGRRLKARWRVCDSGLLQLRTSRHRAAMRGVPPRPFARSHKSWRVRGGDPDIGCRLPGLLRRAGFEVREINPLLRLARPGSPLWDWPDTFFDIYLPVLVKMRLITPAHERAFRREWSKRSRSPDAFFTSPPMVEIIAVKK